MNTYQHYYGPATIPRNILSHVRTMMILTCLCPSPSATHAVR